MNFIRVICFLILLATGTFLIFQGMYFGPFHVDWETALSVQEVRAKADDVELVRRLWAHSEKLKGKWTIVATSGIVVIVVTVFWYVKETGKNWNVLKSRKKIIRGVTH